MIIIVFSLLLYVKLGADLNCLDNEGLSPLDLILLDSPIQRSGGTEI